MSKTDEYSVNVSKKKEKIGTAISAELTPSGSVEPGTTVIFSGELRTAEEYPKPLGGKTIELYVNGGKERETTTTEGGPYTPAGQWSFNITLNGAGTYNIYAQFPGDSEYGGSKSNTYTASVS